MEQQIAYSVSLAVICRRRNFLGLTADVKAVTYSVWFHPKNCQANGLVCGAVTTFDHNIKLNGGKVRSISMVLNLRHEFCRTGDV